MTLFAVEFIYRHDFHLNIENFDSRSNTKVKSVSQMFLAVPTLCLEFFCNIGIFLPPEDAVVLLNSK
jgi:hypothetical protein